MNWYLLLFITITFAKTQIQYPIRFAYVNRIDSWWPIKDIAKGLGVPGYAPKNIYNIFSLTVWTYGRGPLDLAKLWNDPVTYLSQKSDFGKSNAQIRKNIKQKYSNADKKLLVSAFAESEYPTTAGHDPILCATKLAIFVKDTGLDGVDVNYQDTKAFQDGTGQKWVIQFTKKLRQLLPDHIICHAPQAANFHQQNYKNGGYITINREVGNLIDFYNVQFYNQKQEQYNTYQTLFKDSTPDSYILGTSVMQLNKRGIPLNKIVIGKPVSEQNVMNTGLVEGEDLGSFIMKGYQQFGWYTGVMIWEYVSDIQGVFIQAAAGKLVENFLLDQLTLILTTQTTQNTQYQRTQLEQDFSQLQFLTSSQKSQLSNKEQIIQPYEPRKINYPVRFTTVDRIASWWPPSSIAASIGVPGYANDSFYNYFSLSTWTYEKGPKNMAKLWQNPQEYFTDSSEFGNSNQLIRQHIIQKYHEEKIGLLVSAFGSSQNPASLNIQPVQCANKLAQYVIDNSLDGVQIKFFDGDSFDQEKGEFWLIKFTNQLRKLLPNHLIVHTTFPSYFNQSNYRMGGYSMVHQTIGNQIDFYIIYYFDQGQEMPFENYKQIFMLSGPPRKFGVSIRQLIYRGIPKQKIVIGKPALRQNSMNTGWIDVQQLTQIVIRGFNQMRWFTGIMLWEYFSDMNEKMIKAITESLIVACAANPGTCEV